MRFIVDFAEDQATAIEAVKSQSLQPANRAVMYNLQGQQVDNNYRGIVIKYGKKYMKR